MLSTKKTHALFVAVLATVIFIGASTTSDEKRLSIYSSVATYNLPVSDRLGREYVGLLEVLEPLGRISARVEGQHWKLRFNDIDCDFVSGKMRVKIRGRDFDLGGAFLVENSRGLVPLSSLSTLLPRFLGNAVNFHEAARRVFIGGVATQFSAQLDGNNPPRLVLNFSAPVNPTISTEPGKLRMLFAREPVLPAGSLALENAVITQVSFSESNGMADLTVGASAPLMASFSNNGRTITVATAAPVTASTGVANPGGTPPPAIGTPTQGEPSGSMGAQATPPVIPVQRILAIVDPAHGGAERGAALTDTLEEKTVTLGFARLLRHELQRQGFAVLLLRDGDDTLTLDQRAGFANAAHGAIYISLHAASDGTGARVYTALLPPGNSSKGQFVGWDAAQRASLDASRGAAAAVVAEMQKHQFQARANAASLRPLNNVVMPAVAIELAPGPNGVADLPSANYQQRVASAIADGIASLRDRLGSQP